LHVRVCLPLGIWLGASGIGRPFSFGHVSGLLGTRRLGAQIGCRGLSANGRCAIPISRPLRLSKGWVTRPTGRDDMGVDPWQWQACAALGRAPHNWPNTVLPESISYSRAALNKASLYARGHDLLANPRARSSAQRDRDGTCSERARNTDQYPSRVHACCFCSRTADCKDQLLQW
jgi:hypothetical protein